MGQRLDRRRYQDVIRFLRETINGSGPAKLRMQAADRLIALYADADAKAERELQRQERVQERTDELERRASESTSNYEASGKKEEGGAQLHSVDELSRAFAFMHKPVTANS